MRASAGEYIVLLNPDTVVWPRWIYKMRRAFTAEVGAVGPVSDNVAGMQFVGHYMSPKGVQVDEIQDIMTERFSSARVEVKVLIGF